MMQQLTKQTSRLELATAAAAGGLDCTAAAAAAAAAAVEAAAVVTVLPQRTTCATGCGPSRRHSDSRSGRSSS